jgi:hypothetical protein
MTSEAMQAVPRAALTDADLSLLRMLGERESAPAPALPDGAGMQADFEGRYRDALCTAAFLNEFDPAALIPGIEEPDLKLLLRDCTVSTDGIVSRWRLSSAARGRLLRELGRGEAMNRHIAAAERYRERTGEPPDPFSAALVALCRGEFPSRHSLVAAGIETWSAYRAALAVLKDTGIPGANFAETILADVGHAEMMEPFRFLTGWRPVAPPGRHEPHQVFGEDAFVGRRDELKRLRSFVDVLASESVSESFSRGLHRRLRGSGGRALVLSGVGGVGKSTLVAKFILDHTAAGAGLLRFAYLDFDRSTVNTAQPATLVLEIARQLRWQLPGLAPQLDSLRERLRAELRRRAGALDSGSSSAYGDEPDGAGGNPGLPPELVSPTGLHEYVAEISRLLAGSRDAGPPENPTLLLVLDTFEEVQALGDEAVRRIERIVDGPYVLDAGWRTLIVGRDGVAGFFPAAERQELREFSDQASRRAFLEQRGVPVAQSARVAKVAGGRPLALLLAARLVREQGIGAIELSVYQRVGSLFRERLIEGILYERILGHISDPDLRRIAHPGLVLRWIDADVIAGVIVPVLGLSGFPPDKVEKVMAALRRQKDLVRVEPDGSVVHRSDVRAQMLELMSSDHADMVERLHRGAVAYYVDKQGRAGSGEQQQRLRIEELYHRLCLGTDLDSVVERWIAPARSALARALPEILNPQGRVALRLLLGRLPTLEEARELPPMLASQFTVRTVKSAIAYHAPERALEALQRAPATLPAGFLDLYEPLSFDRAGDWEVAREGYAKLARHVAEPEHLLAAADFFERHRIGPPSHNDSVLRQLGNALASVSPRTVDIELALARLGLHEPRGKLPASSELPLCAALLPVSGSATPATQWLVTLTTDVEQGGLALFDGMPVTDAMRRQLNALAMLLADSRAQWAHPGTLSFARALLESRSVGIRSSGSRVRFDPEAAWPVLRHLMRPSTPQWYVPLAAVVRKIVGGVIDTGTLFDPIALPGLPEAIPARVSTTRALAEVFGQFDQHGVLGPVLQNLAKQWPFVGKERYWHMVQAYLSWRAAVFPTLDPWMSMALSHAGKPR